MKFLACFGGGFTCNRKVDTFEKTHNFMTHIPEEIYRHSRTLQELYLDSNNIKDLPKQFFKLVNLKKLSLSDNDLANLGTDISQLSQLVELDLSRNDIPRIPDNIKMLALLETVDFSANPLTKIPDNMCALTSLKHLRINAISLERFPDNIGDLKTLESLEARENMINSLPDSICNLESLQYLDLGENEVDSLPDNFGQLTKLRELWLDTNELKHLPDTIGGLVNLSIADFANNKLEEIPSSISGCKNLTDLTLKENFLSTLPSSIGSLTKLSVLKADQNKLQDLTDEIGKCKALSELILTENLLQSLPSSIGGLSELSVLNVGRNRLDNLTPKIGKCKKLRMLFLRENQLAELPPSIGDLVNIQTLDVAGNRLDWLPDTLLKLDIKAVWLSANQAQPLLTFQEETIETADGSKKVLTCFLLPQQKVGPPPEWIQGPMKRVPTNDDIPKDPTPKVNFPEETDTEDPEPGKNMFPRNEPKRATPHPGDLVIMKKNRAIEAQAKQKELALEDAATEKTSLLAQSEPAEVAVQSDTVPTPPKDEEDLVPLLCTNDEVDSNEEQNRPDRTSVKFQPSSPSEPTESRLKRKNTPHYKRDIQVDQSLNANLLLDATPNLDLKAQPEVIDIELPGEGSFGLSIAGGAGSPPYIEGDGAVFISKVIEDGRAYFADIRVGDKIAKVNGSTVLEESHEEVADILRRLRATSELPIFQLFRYPLVEGFERFVNEDTDSEKDDGFEQEEVVKINGISQQLDFSMMSSDDAELNTSALLESTHTPILATLPNDEFEESDEIQMTQEDTISTDELIQPVFNQSADEGGVDLHPTAVSSSPPPPSQKAPVNANIITAPPSSSSPTPQSPNSQHSSPVQIITAESTNARLSPLPIVATSMTSSNDDQHDSAHSADDSSFDVLPPPPPVQPQHQPTSAEIGNVANRAASPVRTKSPSVQINFQSPKPFKSPDQLDGAQLSFKDKMRLFKTGPQPGASAHKSSGKISLVSAQDFRSIKADESRKLISQSAAELRREKFSLQDMEDSDDLYRQTVALDSGSPSDGPPKRQNTKQSSSKLENPLDALGGRMSKETDISDIEREVSISMGKSVSPRDWQLENARNRQLRQQRMKQFDDDAIKAQKVLKRERSLKEEKIK